MISLVHVARSTGGKHLAQKEWYEDIQKSVRFCVPKWIPMDTAIVFLSEKDMRRINRRYHKQDKATDILSFFYPGKKRMNEGELYVCIPRIRQQANQYGLTFMEEYVRVLTHGFLHLQGYVHAKKKESKVMEALAEKIISQIKGNCLW